MAELNTDSRGRRPTVRNNSWTPANQIGFVVNMLIGERVSKVRTSLGMTAKELAKRAGLRTRNPRQFIHGIENTRGRFGVRLGTVYALAKGLGVDISVLLPSSEEVERVRDDVAATDADDWAGVRRAGEEPSRE